MPVPQDRIIDGDTTFARGANSLVPAIELPAGAYVRSINMLNRGGGLQTRPGFRWMATLPVGEVQGFTMFTPRGQTPQLLAVIGGTVYVSLLPYTEWAEVPGITLSETALRVYFAHCSKSVERNEDLSITVVTPVNTLVIQDGQSAPAFYDGTSSGHITGASTTPVGTAMAWSGDRLWVANGNQVFVSDIADPYSFVEETYNTLGGKEYFLVEGEITGMAETPGIASPQLLVFTDSKTTLFQSNVRERTLWPELIDFQRTLLPNVGAVSQRSIVPQHGLLFWMSAYGLVSFDSALLAQQSSELAFHDNEMAFSKSRLNGDLSGVAGISYENYLLMSVPYADQYNPHTWVLDFTVRNLLNERSPRAWSSVWTGIRPIEWASGSIQGVPRIFCLSRDLDGRNRVWEAFTSLRRDEFCDIDWGFESRAYTMGDISLKEFRFAELTLSDLRGAVDLKVSWAGATKGPYREIANVRFFANEGVIDATQELPERIFALKSQTRRFRTQDIKGSPSTSLSACGVEASYLDSRDVGFQFCVQGSGPCAVQQARVFMDILDESNEAACQASEAEGRFIRIDGAGSTELEALQEDLFPTFSAVASATATYGDTTVSASATAISSISQEAADKLALQRAQAEANAKLAATADPFEGGGVEVEVFTGSLDFSIASNSQYLVLF